MKLYRLLAIVTLLLNRGRISANEMAEYFEVSKRTIYRDIETINQAGIPIVSYQGTNGGFGIMDNYKIDKNLLTPNDMLSIVTALRGISKTIDDRMFNDALEKIKGLIPENIKEKLQKNEEIIIDFTPWGGNKREREKANLIRNAITDNRVICFQYTNTQRQSLERSIEPMSIVLKGYSWYLYGYCRNRKDYRFFKLSRLTNLYITEEKFSKRELSYNEFICRNSSSDPRKNVQLFLRFHPNVRVVVEDYFGVEMIEYDQDGFLNVEVNYPEDEWVYGFLLSFGPNLEVIEPPHIREIISNRAKKIAEIYQKKIKKF